MPELDLTETYLDLDGIIARLGREDPDRVLPVGFGEPHSFRGDYSELAFNPARNVTIGSMLGHARAARGATFHGWKGGEYDMDGTVTCWIAEPRDSGDNRIGPLLLELMLAHSAKQCPTSGPLADLHRQVTVALGHATDAERKAEAAGREGDALMWAVRASSYGWVLERIDEQREAPAEPQPLAGPRPDEAAAMLDEAERLLGAPPDWADNPGVKSIAIAIARAQHLAAKAQIGILRALLAGAR